MLTFSEITKVLYLFFPVTNEMIAEEIQASEVLRM